jgi:hypothetical protein
MPPKHQDTNLHQIILIFYYYHLPPKHQDTKLHQIIISLSTPMRKVAKYFFSQKSFNIFFNFDGNLKENNATKS